MKRISLIASLGSCALGAGAGRLHPCHSDDGVMLCLKDEFGITDGQQI
ncbi:MAG: hypothetical protein ACI3YJ_11030 [Prevotella sp.]